ncbi:MAG: trehalose-6-phosphate synthase [Candidatus Alcyoniella australis]|nr:trehalose-6-phosphate synthase [Candidatus Alcyoniella australis]
MGAKRLVVVSNRLPIVVNRDPQGARTIKPGSGGLVTALAPLLRNRGGIWIGWPGAPQAEDLHQLLQSSAHETGYKLVPVGLSEQEIGGYYQGFSNQIIWPLFHDLPSRANFDPSYWPIYCQVNRKFANTIVEVTNEDDFIWIQDYHLMMVASELCELGQSRKTGFFLHIPFPPLDVFLKLPWRKQILDGLLRFDLLGFQTARDRRNFISCVRTLDRSLQINSKRQVISITANEREIRIGTFPISIDVDDFVSRAKSPAVADLAWAIHSDLPERQLVLGLDRLDYSKGIPDRILAIDELLKRHPEQSRKFTFIQVVVPSRAEMPEYRFLRREIERLVGQVNGRHTVSGWTPIHYIYRSLTPVELVAYYRTCEVALLTPLKDGMNLVAKEYCAASIEENGTLILSEFAGAATQLANGALLVNPFDLVGTAEAINSALTMDAQERRSRMRAMRRSIARNDIYHWVDSFLRAAIAKNLNDFPKLEHYSLPLGRS